MRSRSMGGLPLLLKILVLVILVYMGGHIYMYFNSSRASIYEVQYGYLSKNNTLRGLCLRDEQSFSTSASGHINYFTAPGDRVGVNSLIYSLDNNGSIYEYIKDTKEALSVDELRGIREISRGFFEYFDSESFNESSIYSSKLEVYLNNLKAERALKGIKKLAGKTSLEYTNYGSNTSGNIAFYTDGFEGKKLSDLKYEQLSDTGYRRTTVNNNDVVQKGDVVYKLLKSEKWQMLCPLESDMYDQLDEIIRNSNSLSKSINVTVKFLADSSYTGCTLSLEKMSGQSYALLSFNDSAVRFLDYRYMDVELQLKSIDGLQIPITALVQKSFYKVPMEYVDKGGSNTGSSYSYGILKKLINTKPNDADRAFVEVIRLSGDESFAYVDVDKFEDSNIIIDPDDNGRQYELTERISLNGVYNINKGYAVFNYVKIIDKNDQYYILDDRESVLSEFDHIILYGNEASDNMILH